MHLLEVPLHMLVLHLTRLEALPPAILMNCGFLSQELIDLDLAICHVTDVTPCSRFTTMLQSSLLRSAPSRPKTMRLKKGGSQL